MFPSDPPVRIPPAPLRKEEAKFPWCTLPVLEVQFPIATEVASGPIRNSSSEESGTTRAFGLSSRRFQGWDRRIGRLHPVAPDLSQERGLLYLFVLTPVCVIRTEVHICRNTVEGGNTGAKTLVASRLGCRALPLFIRNIVDMQIRSMTFSKCEFAGNYNRPMLRSMPPSWYVSICASLITPIPICVLKDIHACLSRHHRPVKTSLKQTLSSAAIRSAFCHRAKVL